MIVAIVLLAVAALPLGGLFLFRLYENQLVRETESELIVQTTMLATIFAQQVERSGAFGQGGLRPVAPGKKAEREDRFHPIEPRLDLTADDILGRRPDAMETSEVVDPKLQRIGTDVYAIAQKAQEVTLAGFRIVDPNGVVIAGGEEAGRSLANVEEVAMALRGDFRSVLRVRVSNDPPPPLYSMSRGTSVRVFVAMPVLVAGRVAGVIYASRTPNNIFRSLYNERLKLTLAGACILAVILVIGFLFSRAISRPIQTLIRETHKLSHRGMSLDDAPQHYGTREIASLSASFHEMARRLSERSSYIANFAAHVSHELKSPVTAIQGAAELLLDDATTASPSMEPAQRRRFLENMIGDTKRLIALLQRLRDLAQVENLQTIGPTPLDEVAMEVNAAFPELDIRWNTGPRRSLPLSRENGVMLFSHLADNAMRHGSTELRIDLERRGDLVTLTVADNGLGISKANRDRIFDPFFTTRRDFGGTGMGLHIVRSLLRSHKGSISLLPSSKGATFAITIPVA
ncbi:MAG: HAMP domain-containing protein [Hyphomicrobiales bacterium]|nr:HAMP domain-containing protein [Hyphomicrobiales bacterium]